MLDVNWEDDRSLLAAIRILSYAYSKYLDGKIFVNHRTQNILFLNNINFSTQSLLFSARLSPYA
jgi:hypothetical protein